MSEELRARVAHVLGRHHRSMMVTQRTCNDCAITNANDLLAALAASGATLDVERLAEALTIHRVALMPRRHLGHSCMGDCAPAIAAEYARLSGAVTEREP